MKNITECRCCGNQDLHLYLDLGSQPLANSYHKGEVLETYPLEVNLCKSCFHSQLSVVIDPKIMFEHYLYVSSTTKTFRDHCDTFAEEVCLRVPNPKVLDIACNDGLLLECFRKRGCEVQGVDPSVNLRELTKEKNIPVEVGLWSEEIAEKIGKFDVITATNVFAHVHDVEGFLKACKKSLTPDGFVVIEFPYCRDMISKCEFDTIYHEHLSYFLVNSFNTLIRRCGFGIFDIIQTPIHGWSIRFFIKPNIDNCSKVQELIEIEQEKGMLDITTYQKFSDQVKENKKTFKEEVAKYPLVVGYGASAKGNTMLNFFELELQFIVDDNPMKWGYKTPGMNIPIIRPEHLNKFNEPLAIVILSWNFAKEIIQKIIAIRNNSKDVCLLYVPTTQSIPVSNNITVSEISA